MISNFFYGIFEAGTRVPFITYWKGTIQPAVSDAIVCQMDLVASIADLVGTEETTADSKDLLSTFLGKTTEGRTNLIIEATGKTALRSGDWLLIPAYQGKNFREEVGIEVGNFPTIQLYNLKVDKGQTNNLASVNSEKVAELLKVFIALRGSDYEKGVKEVVFK